jgi:hypothetical protein
MFYIGWRWGVVKGGRGKNKNTPYSGDYDNFISCVQYLSIVENSSGIIKQKTNKLKREYRRVKSH